LNRPRRARAPAASAEANGEGAGGGTEAAADGFWAVPLGALLVRLGTGPDGLGEGEAAKAAFYGRWRAHPRGRGGGRDEAREASAP